MSRPETLVVDPSGLCAAAIWVPSPHHDARPPDTPIELLVIHSISLPPREFGGPWIDELFLGRLDAKAHPAFAPIAALEVSAHFLIRRDGELRQYVACERRAWHAGVSTWRGRSGCNDFSIGIELEGADDVPFAEPQYEMLARLTQALFSRYGPLGLAAHSEIAPQRKTDPGTYFDWERYRAAVT